MYINGFKVFVLGSNPSFRAKRKACNRNGYRLFLVRFCGCFPLCFPLPEIFPLNLDKDTPGGTLPSGVSLCLLQVVIVALHPVGGIALHLVGGVGVYVQRKRCCCVPQKILYRFDVSSGGNSNCGASVTKIMWAEIWSSYAGSNPLMAQRDRPISSLDLRSLTDEELIALAEQCEDSYPPALEAHVDG